MVELSHPGAELRLLEVFYHKIYKIGPLMMFLSFKTFSSSSVLP
ncbi:hypothetical protein V6N13_038058 [Hibiscus sabdariffa]